MKETIYVAEYTKLDGTRNSKEFASLERLEEAFERVRKEHPAHKLDIKITKKEREFNFPDVRPLTRKEIHLERCQAAYEARVRGYSRH